MVIYKKGVLFLFLSLFLISFISSAGQVVQVAPEPEEKKGFFASTFGFLKSPIFWWIVAGVVFFLLLAVGLFFFVRWLVKFLKSRSNIFYQLRTQRIKLAKVHRRYPDNHFISVEKNTPIKLVKLREGKPIISDTIAYYRGDYTSHEGNIIVSLNMRFNKKWFFVPITDILIIPTKEKIVLSQKDAKGKTIQFVLDNLPNANEIIQFNEHEILLYAEGISNIGAGGNEFFVPVLRAKDGKIIDLSLPLYQSLKDVVVGDYLFEQTDEFTKVAKKSIDMNPSLRYATKSADSNQNVEIPQN
jgi:hypothetical protein